MSRLNDCSEKQTILNYAQSAAQDLVKSTMGDFIAPTVEVPTASGFFKKYSAKNAYSIPNTRRNPGEAATTIRISQNDEMYNCLPHSLDCPIDIIESVDDKGFKALFQNASDLVAEAAALDFENKVINTAISVAKKVDITIDNTTNLVDCMDDNIDELIRKTGLGMKLHPRIVFGTKAWRIFKNHPSVKDVIGNLRNYLVPSINDISGLLFGNPEARIMYSLKDKAPIGKEKLLEYILDDKILLFVASQKPTLSDPSFMKTFRLNGEWMKVDSYKSSDGRQDVAKMDWSQDIKVTNADAGILISLN